MVSPGMLKQSVCWRKRFSKSKVSIGLKGAELRGFLPDLELKLAVEKGGKV